MKKKRRPKRPKGTARERREAELREAMAALRQPAKSSPSDDRQLSLFERRPKRSGAP